MKFEHLTPEQSLALGKFFEFAIFITLGIFTTLWWLPAYAGEKHPISWQQATMFFTCLLVLFLNPITRFGFRHLGAGYKHFAQGNGSFIPLRLRIFIVAASTIGYAYGLQLSA